MNTITNKIAAGRRLLDAATPGRWEAFGNSAGNVLDQCNCAGPTELYDHEQYCGIEGPVASADEADIAWIVWARNNLPTLLNRLDQWAIVIDAGANILENNAMMLEHLVMDTPKDQELTDRIVDQTRHAAQSMRTALNAE